MLGIAVNKKSLVRAFLTVILIGGLFLASVMRFRTVQASTDVNEIPKPSIPEFTAQLADHSYDVPATTTTTTNPYNGEVITNTEPGYHVQNITIDLTIENQPYPAIINGNESFVYFNVRIKGHFGQDWAELFPYYSDSPVQSSSEYTVISLPANYHVGDQIDIQVQAAIGYKIITLIGHPPIPNVYTRSVDFQHASSDWSTTQTISIPEGQTPTPSPTITPTPLPTSTPYQEPQQTEQPETIIGVAIVVTVFAVGSGFLVYLIKRK
jgi:hypothetical protein